MKEVAPYALLYGSADLVADSCSLHRTLAVPLARASKVSKITWQPQVRDILRSTTKQKVAESATGDLLLKYAARYVLPYKV
jgi:hypothetical protein